MEIPTAPPLGSGSRCVTQDQGGEAWLEARKKVDPAKGGLTASTIPDVMGVGYNSRKQRWEFARGKPQVFDAFAQKIMDRGKVMEAAAADDFKAKVFMLIPAWDSSGFTMEETGLWLNSDFPFFGATPDRILRCPGWEDELLEIKCPMSTENFDPQSEKCLRYLIQLEVQLRMVNAKAGHLWVYGDTIGPSFYVYWPRNDELWALIRMYCERFRTLVITNTPPPSMTAKEKEPLAEWWHRSAPRTERKRLNC